ncbi:MAG: FKBP-type peptidyl-prolyl cis-trans isomerase [Mediterranea sp.]|nr:FKBP-type peptidyl-prolyl cis-trans isomerase [Mediterranea sp.]
MAEAPEYLVTKLYAENGIDIFDKNFSGDDPGDFDSPSTFGVSQVITGWTEILQLMRPGDRFEVYVPYESGYGTTVSSSGTLAYSTLIFDMKMERIVEY